MSSETAARQRHAGRVADLRAALREAKREQRAFEDKVRRIGPEPTGQHTMIRFEVRFPDCEQTYVYLGLRVGDLWYVTGKLDQEYRANVSTTWDRLVEAMTDDGYVLLTVATPSDRLVDEQVAVDARYVTGRYRIKTAEGVALHYVVWDRHVSTSWSVAAEMGRFRARADRRVLAQRCAEELAARLNREA